MLQGDSLAFLAIHLISSLVMLFFATLVFLHNHKETVNKVFIVMMLGTIGWALANIGTFNVASENFKTALNLALVFASVQTLSLPVFVYLFPKTSFAVKTPFKVLFVIFALVYIGVAPFGMNIDPEIKYPNTNIPIAEPNGLNAIWGIIMLIFIVFSIVVAVSKLKKADPEQKPLFRAILLGTASTFALLFASQYFTVNVLKTPILNSYGPLFVMPLVIGTSYALTKFRLFNIKAIATELITFGLWLFLLLRLLFSNSVQDYIVNAVVLLGVIVIGIFLIKSVLTEVRQKEELAKVNSKLKDLNDHLEQKVAEQTIEIRRAYEVEKKARIELEKLDKAKNEFILTTQHNLRTPLTIIIGYLDSLRKSITSKNIDETTLESVNKANEAADRLGHLTNELLNVTEMQIGEKVLKKESGNN